MKIKIIIQTENKDINGKPDLNYLEKYNRLQNGISKLEDLACKIAKGEE